jgi:hypothetical protein
MQTSRWTASLVAVALASALASAPGRAASHREAPLMTLDPGADITDVYAFVSYDQANLDRAPADRKVTLIMNVVPGQEPGSGPNYFAFDDNVLYEIKVDNDRDGTSSDVIYQFRFQTEVTNPDQFLATLGGGPLPPVSRLEGDGSEGLSRKQRFTVTEIRDCKFRNKGPKCRSRTPLFGGRILPTVPSNIGPRTMPGYESLVAQGIHVDDETGIRVFAGQRAETFAIDLGAVFDTVFLRVENATPIPMLRPPLPIQTAAEDANDFANPFGVNNFSGFNVNTIAIEVPITRLTMDGQPANATNGTIGVWTATSRQMVTVRSGIPGKVDRDRLLEGAKSFRQVSRMANPLVNELIIPIGLKDLWNATDANAETQFLDAYRNLAIAGALQAIAGPAVTVPDPPREDVVRLLLKYDDQDPSPDVGPFSELLRLDMTVPPTSPNLIARLGPFAHDADGDPTPTPAGDPAGFPNGRRPNDDVTDLVVRVAGGPDFFANFVGDGVGVQEQGITPDFPFLPTPHDGRNRRHRDPGEE